MVAGELQLIMLLFFQENFELHKSTQTECFILAVAFGQLAETVEMHIDLSWALDQWESSQIC